MIRAIDRAGFAASNRKLGVSFDAVYTAEDIGSYKPDPRNFAYLLDRLSADHSIAQGDILHTAQSLFPDHGPARDPCPARPRLRPRPEDLHPRGHIAKMSREGPLQ